MSFDPEKLLDTLRGLPAARCYWVGFSGGLDSTLLLSALALHKHALTGELRAVHVNHHLNPHSDDWQTHCERVCRSLKVVLECRGITIKPEKGASLEALARTQRYGVYRKLLRKDDMLLLAHHQDDQLETFLLQALRGAGLRGLAAIPRMADFGAGKLVRPLLEFTRADLQAWAEAHQLVWLEDPSNADERFDRNYLRQQVIPLLRARWPAAAETVDRSTCHCGEALELLATLAEDDLSRCMDSEGRSLTVAALQKLGQVRAKNLLRHWFEKLGLSSPPAHKLEQIFSEVLTARADRNPCVAWEGAELHRYHGRLYALPPLPDAPQGECRLQVRKVQSLGAGLGTLHVVTAVGEGLRAGDCPAEGFKVRFRAGGEVCQPAGRAHRRPLKKWLQEMAVVPWMRERLPLIYAGEELAAVVGLFVCEPFAAGKDEPGLRIDWQSHPRLH